MTVSYHTVLTGAGISFGAPSQLPRGDELAVIAWDLATENLGIDEGKRAAIRERIRGQALRLEELLELIQVGEDGIPLDSLVTVYRSVSSRTFNYVHARLTQLAGVQHFTVNMDCLLESAASGLGTSLKIEHLHGVWDDPDTIITTISQYLNELPEPVQERLGKAFAGKNVLVAGYSARDRDISPLFVRFPPAELTWLIHPSVNDPNLTAEQVREKELSPEARHLLETLGCHHPTQVDERRSTTEDFLDGILPPPADALQTLRQDLSSKAPRVTWVPDPKARTAYGLVDISRRRIAAAAVFANEGDGDAALAQLKQVSRRGDAGVRIAKMKARVLRRRGKPFIAILCLLSPVPGVKYPAQFRSVINEISAALGGTVLYRVADRIDRTLVSRGSAAGAAGERVAFLAGVRLAQRLSARGDLDHADALFARFHDPASRRLVGLGAWVNMLTWHADVMKVRGDATSAMSLLRGELDDTFYADVSQRAMLEWKLAELQLVMAGPDADTVAELERLATLPVSAVGWNAHCWIQLTRVGATRGQILTDAPTTHEELRKLAAARRDTQLFLQLQLAEAARTVGDTAAVRRHIHLALRNERQRTAWTGSITGRLAAQVILTTARLQEGSGDRDHLLRDLHGIEQHAARIGAMPISARARTNRALASGEAVPAALCDRWRNAGWKVEAERGVGNGQLDDLWQIVM